MGELVRILEGFLPGGMRMAQLAVFGLLCGVLGAVVLFLNWVLLRFQNITVIDIGYGAGNRFGLALGWSAAAALIGVLAAALQIVQLNLLAALSVAVGWPLILAKIVDMVSVPVQQVSGE